MIRPRLLPLSLAALALLGARTALADPIKFTGYVENDFSTTDPNVAVFNVLNSPLDVGPSQFMINNGWVSGWAIKDIRVSYDSKSDTLSVGFDTFKNAQGQPAIVGDADGNGDPGGASPQMAKAGGIDSPHLGGSKSVGIALAGVNSADPSQPGPTVLVAGVPADKSTAGPGIDGFTVSLPKGNSGVAYNFGKSLTNASGNPVGQLAFDPSSAHPGFEFSINNFSKVSGIDPAKGFWMEAFAGAAEDVVVGSAGMPFVRIPAFDAQNVPEPATILAWSLVAAAAGLRYRRRASVVG